MKHQARKMLAALLFSSLVISFLALQTQAQTSQEILDQYISDLQKNPNDKALREKIIRMASELEPRPVIPDEAKRPFYKAATFFKEAQDPSGYDLAIRAYKDAIRIAPWWPEAYFNLGIAQEKAELFGEAVETLKLYLLTQPEDAEDAEKKLYELEAKGELAAKAAKESSPEAVAARNEQYFVDEVHEGIVDLNIGRLEDAIQHWEKALEISPENQQVDVPLYNIGEAYMNLNDLDKAYEKYHAERHSQ